MKIYLFFINCHIESEYLSKQTMFVHDQIKLEY